jgi:hypothetical protein
MPGTSTAPVIVNRRDASLGSIYPGGAFAIVANTLANPTVVSTLAPHGLTTGDTVFFTASTTSNPLLTATPQQVVTVISATTFSVPVNVTTAGTAGAFDYAIISIPISNPGIVNTGTAHGLRTGDTVTIVAAGSTPDISGAQIVTVTSTNQFTVPVNVTVAGSTTAAHYSKTTFYSDAFERGSAGGGGGIVLTSLIGTAPVTTLVDIQGTFDGTNWYNLAYATTAAPQTALYAQLTITTAVATSYKLLSSNDAGYIGWRQLRLKFTSSTNIIVSGYLYTAIS